ncbi:MAG: DUF3536 domain-containing protein [Parachlamydiales bacterium]|jgi:alpha-amylase/alpha-mannosidase (GH57 family)
MNRFICIHGHFYQPPRENPWLETIEQQDTAFPYHDWNERIFYECYAPNVAARIVDSNQMIIDIVNNYSKMSFNFGPTLFTWLEKNYKNIYEAIIQADKKSQAMYMGHGAAIAQCYSHMIMPLANLNDKKTQVIWGIKDFEHRFNRKPEGMWLPECAVDYQTLELFAENGIKFTILSPYQADKIKKVEEKNWVDVNGGKINPQFPYLCNLPSGKKIIIFFYDGSISHDIAFSDLLKNGDNFANRLIGTFPNDSETRLVHVATDGETFGHHHKFGDMALAHCFRRIEKDKNVDSILYAAFLEKSKVLSEVKIIENSSWSCAHGVGRWSKDCGCKIDPNSKFNQKWREPLRNALDYLRDNLNELFQVKMKNYFEDPWQIRNDYIDLVLDRSLQNTTNFFNRNLKNQITENDKALIFKLLEMQRNLMAMYTSCGWFFDEISRIETLQILQYAARAIQLASEVDQKNYEDGFISMLEKAASNIEEYKNGGYIYRSIIKPKILDLKSVAVHFAILSLFEKKSENSSIYCYFVETSSHEIFTFEDKKISFGNASVFCNLTWQKVNFNFVAIYYGEQNVKVGINIYEKQNDFSKIFNSLKDSFLSKDLAKTDEIINSNFTSHDFSFWDLFQDDKRKILKRILKSAIHEITTSLQNIHSLHYSLITEMREKKLLLPAVLVKSLDLMLSMDLMEILDDESINFDQLKKTIEEVKKWGFQFDIKNLSFKSLKRIEAFMEHLSADPYNINILNQINEVFEIFSTIPMTWNLWKAQNIYFSLLKKFALEDFKTKRAEEGSIPWIEGFKKLGKFLSVKI